eukprot:7875184-Pyramimonas_sp.AAC.1
MAIDIARRQATFARPSQTSVSKRFSALKRQTKPRIGMCGGKQSGFMKLRLQTLDRKNPSYHLTSGSSLDPIQMRFIIRRRPCVPCVGEWCTSKS